jgi:site-specific DNA-methyltransferase (adenine-specific)
MFKTEFGQLLHGDCVAIMKDLPDDSFGLSFADPPYNNKTKYDGYSDDREDYLDWCHSWFTELRRISNRVVITPGHGNFWMWKDIEKPWGVGAWYKPGNPCSSVLGWEEWEPWLFYCKDYRAVGGGNVIKAPVSKQSGIIDHPCPKPLLFLVRLIQKCLWKKGENQSVFDPFMGSGTTAKACELLKIKWMGVELSLHYCQMIKARITGEFPEDEQPKRGYFY